MNIMSFSVAFFSIQNIFDILSSYMATNRQARMFHSCLVHVRVEADLNDLDSEKEGDGEGGDDQLCPEAAAGFCLAEEALPNSHVHNHCQFPSLNLLSFQHFVSPKTLSQKKTLLSGSSWKS